MVNKLIKQLNDDSMTFTIQDVCENNNIDYALLSINPTYFIVEVDYSEGVIFKRIPEDKRREMLRTFYSRLTPEEKAKTIIC